MAKTYACLLVGLDVVEVEIETIVGLGFSGLTLLGLRSDITRDMRERVRAALESIGIPIPAKRIVVNISPQEILKLSRIPLQELDFAVAASIIMALFDDQGIRLPDIGKEFFAGELSLTGQLKTAQNTLIYNKIANIYKNQNLFSISLHASSQKEHHEIFQNYPTLASWLSERKHQKTKNAQMECEVQMPEWKVSSADIQNVVANIQILLKNPKVCVAILIAVAGNHHLLLAGEPGIGKSFSMQKIKHLLTPPHSHQHIEIKLIHSHKFDTMTRPFRAPHHSCSFAALVGGQFLKPGEVTLAHHGVLFLDEIAEFSRNALEALREPMDCGRIDLAKALGSVSYPAQFLLCATMNPCPCGYFLSQNKPCFCKPSDTRQYLSKISGPLLDRFCLQLFMERPKDSFDESMDIFSNYLLGLDTVSLHAFAKNFLTVQAQRHSLQNNFDSEEIPNQKDVSDSGTSYTSLRAQNKIFRLKNTFRKIFPALSSENNFTDDILKYRNFNHLINKGLIH